MLHIRMKAAVAATIAGTFFFSPGAVFAAGGLAPHRAVYAMKMLGSDEGSDIASVSGRLVIEWQGSQCEGFVTNQRIVNRMTSKQGPDFVSDFRVSSWEAPGGDDFTFSMIHYINGNAVEEIEGAAKRDGDGGKASLSKPDDAEISLPKGVVFPTEQLRATLVAAQAGKRLHSAPVFDGSDTENYFETTTILGKRDDGAPTGSEEKAGDPLDKMTFWPVQVSYFNPTDVTGVPDYEVSFRMYENGVSTGLVMDYGDLVLGASLIELDILPKPEC